MLELYQRDPYVKSACTQVLDVTSVKKRPALRLAESILYPGGGGQPCDRGWITVPGGGRVAVTRVLKMNGKIYAVLAEDAPVAPGDRIDVEVDWEPRYRNMRCHTSTHVLNGALAKSVTGYVSEGIEVSEDGLAATSRFQGAWPADRETALAHIETSNRLIAEGRRVEIVEYGALSDAIAKVGPVYRDPVGLKGPVNIVTIARVGSIYRGPVDLKGPVSVVVVEDWDANPCGGTHVRNANEVGPLRLLDFGPSHIRFALQPYGAIGSA